MDKKAKIALPVLKKSMTSFLKRRNLLTKPTSRNAAKKTFLLPRYFLALIVIVNFFLYYVVMLLSGSYEIHYCLLYLIGSRSFLKKRKRKKV